MPAADRTQISGTPRSIARAMVALLGRLSGTTLVRSRLTAGSSAAPPASALSTASGTRNWRPSHGSVSVSSSSRCRRSGLSGPSRANASAVAVGTPASSRASATVGRALPVTPRSWA